MTVMAAEKVGEGARKARRARQVRGEVLDSSHQRFQGSAGPPRARPAAEAYAGQAREVGRAGLAARVPGNRNYQGIILAEFLVAVLLVTMTPIATGGSAAARSKGSPSPYDTGDLKQLVAIGAVFFVLALTSSGGHGRVSAWIGGLILLAIGMSKAGQSQLTAVFRTASGQEQAQAEGPVLQ